MSGCYNRDIHVDAPIVDPVTHLEYTLEDDTVRVTWNLPVHTQILGVQIAHTDGLTILSNNPTSFNYGVIKVGKEYSFTFKVTDEAGNISLGKTFSLEREGGRSVENVKAIQIDDTKDVSISWTLPDEVLSKVIIRYDDKEVELSGTATSYLAENLSNKSYSFGIVSYNDKGQSSETVYVNIQVGNTKVAFLGVANTWQAIEDDDEKAAADWFFQTYPSGEYVSFGDIAEGRDLNQYRMLWWIYDSEVDSRIPDAALVPEALNAVRTFYRQGGGLLLNTHAVGYLWDLGRMTANFERAVGADPGGDNPDIWSMNVYMGRVHDESQHPIHQGIPYIMEDGRKLIQLLGAGWKEDHNMVFTELGKYYGLNNDDEALYRAISEDSNIRILATWSDISDYYMMANFEALPTEEFQGTAIAIGIGAFEWNQNSGQNPYQKNIEQITYNAIEYLKTK